MGRRTKRASEVKEKTEWIFNIGIELNVESKARIAFLSGLERTYYPEDPGCSKFGLVFQTSGFETDTPPCTFIPQPNIISKPISNRGYGIGGLSAPRFPPLTREEELPSPDKYQPELVRPLLKSSRRPVPPEDDFFHLSPNEPLARKKLRQLHDQRNLQCLVSFGTDKATSRFGKPPLFNTAGVGSYTAMIKDAPSLKTASSFGRSPVLYEPSTDVRCVFDKEEKCIECGNILDISDFYRTRFSVRVPLPETRPIEYLENDFPKGIKHVNLCNVCYHRASLGRSNNWPKTKLRWLFKKTRTCAFIHDHQGMKEVIHRADCKTFKRLQRKETILSKYYADRVEESLQSEDHYYY